MCIFAVASTMYIHLIILINSLWIASKCVSLQWQAQFTDRCTDLNYCCELLQNVYLCSGKHNPTSVGKSSFSVVNCFKMCIFAVASTIKTSFSISHSMLWIASKCVSLQWQAQWNTSETYWFLSCELLQNVYLCSGKHNYNRGVENKIKVVNCFKMCIFAVASTIFSKKHLQEEWLWIASKCVSLQWQAQCNVE